MSLIIVCNWDGVGRFPASRKVLDQVLADAALARILPDNPEAFIAPDPGGDPSYWIVDESAQTVVNDQAQADADSLESNWANLRAERDSLLASSDWTQGTDSPLADKVNWAVYRQELRDLPATTDDPVNPTWPTKPTGD